MGQNGMNRRTSPSVAGGKRLQLGGSLLPVRGVAVDLELERQKSWLRKDCAETAIGSR